MTPADIWARILEAADVMRRLQVTIGPGGFRSHWPDIVTSASLTYSDHDAVEEIVPPRGQEIDRTDEVMDWLTCLDRRDQKILWSRANGAQWWRIAQRLRVSEKTAKRWHTAAIGIIARHAEQKKMRVGKKTLTRMSDIS